VFVACSGDSTIAVLDPATGKPVGDPVPVEPNPAGMAAGAGHVWVTGVGASTLTRLDF
jgi:hypothetical protein